ncbi:Zinc-type alcohol dehydrogenase-like protein [Fusarium oxysporum f. sp. albedinis]|nr:Zinc-type alcohol dehydrogenase-like protein [Fusarium oxysporum f. sp. albedinis]
MSGSNMAAKPLKRARQGEADEQERVVRNRSSVACQACRLAKTRCDINPFAPPCTRCAAASIPCHVPESRRGRMKGSKNFRTWQQILDVEHTATSESSHEKSNPHSHSGPDNVGQDGGESSEPHGPGAITPLDPHNLMRSLDQNLHGNSSRFTRKLLRFLGEQFPVGNEREPQNINEQGWVLDESGLAKRIRHVTSLPTTELPLEDAQLLKHWTPQALQQVVGEMTRYFEYGLRGSKHDVARDIDPLQRGMITESRATALFKAYFKMVHPQWSMLDPNLHTLDFVRHQSALLTTTILALGSIAIATLPESDDGQVVEALNLRAHAEKLSLVVYSTGARSLEIVQAQVLLSRFGGSSKTRLDEQRWLRSAMIPRMAAEIGLGGSGSRGHSETSLDQVADDHWNELRTRAFMILNEYRFSTFSGRAPLDMSYFELQEADIQSISALGADNPSSSLPALYHLYLFQREVGRRLGTASSAASSTALQLEADLAWVVHYTETWVTRWCVGNSNPGVRWHLVHDALSCQLLMSSRIIGRLPQTEGQAAHKKYLLDIAIRIFQEALDAPQGTHMTHRASIFPFAGALILQCSDRRDLVLRLALRMAGRPDKQYVPTFIRSAGNQLLAMLCSNHDQPRPRTQPVKKPFQTPNFEKESCPEDEARKTEHHAIPRDYVQINTQPSGSKCSSDLDTDLDLAPSSQSHGFEVARENAVSSERSRGATLRTDEHNTQATGLQQPAEMPESEDFAINMAIPFSQETAANTQENIHLNTAQTHTGDFLSLDTWWDFPCAPTTLSPNVPLFVSHEPITDLEMLMRGDQVWSYEDVSQQQDAFASIAPAETSPPIQQYLGVFSRSAGNYLTNEYVNLAPGDGEFGTRPPRWDTCSPVYIDPTAGGDGQQTLEERQEYRQTLFQTIGRLLEIASAS